MSAPNADGTMAVREVGEVELQSGSRIDLVKLSGLALPVILLLFILVFSVLEPQTFFALRNFQLIGSSQAVLGVLALAALLPLIIGQFDLSVGSNLGLGLIVTTGTTALWNWPTPLGILAALLACSAVGALNGALVARLQLNAFVVTLATATALTGVVTWITGGTAIAQNIPPNLIALARGTVLGVPKTVIYLAVIAVVLAYLLRFTPVGRFLHALGGSPEAARLAGLNVAGLTFSTFVAAGFLAGLAGAMQAAVLGSGSPTIGPAFLLPAFAGCFLGATSIRPGTFNVLGTIIAVYTIAVGTAGLILLGAPFYIEPIFAGSVLVLAAISTRYLNNYRIKRSR